MFRKTCALALAALPAAHAAFPERPITLIVPFPAGGPTDIVGRLAAAKAGEILGQQIVVENRTGASGTIGMAATARQARRLHRRPGPSARTAPRRTCFPIWPMTRSRISRRSAIW